MSAYPLYFGSTSSGQPVSAGGVSAGGNITAGTVSTTGDLVVNSTSTNPARILNPGQAVGAGSTLFIGAATTANNAALIQFNNTSGAGNANNYAGVGVAGGVPTQFFGNGDVKVPGSVQSSGPTSQFGNSTIIRTGYNAPGTGANAVVSVNGSLAAAATTTEHLLRNNWAGNNSVAVQNTSTNNSSSAIRFLNNAYAERTAIGYGNPQGDSGWTNGPWADAVYWEASNFVNADGSNTSGTVPTIRIVQTGTIAGSNASHVRLQFSNDGSMNYYSLGGIGTMVPLLKATAAGNVGIGDGTSWQVGAYAPQANLDVYGNAIIGKVALAAGFRQTNGAASTLCVMAENTSSGLLRLVRNQIVKCDLNINNNAAGNRLDFVDTDHASVVPLSLMLDGSNNVSLTGFPATGQFGGGAGVIWINNATTVPTVNTPAGGLLYVSGGSLKFRGSLGTVTTIAAA